MYVLRKVMRMCITFSFFLRKLIEGGNQTLVPPDI